MEVRWEECKRKERRGARILEVFTEDREAELPDRVRDISGEELPVLELADYAFSEMRQGKPVEPREGKMPLCGSRLEAVSLPQSLRRIGRYAFYNCEGLKRLTFFTSIEDLGAGLFTGCRNIRDLDVRIVEGKKSCLSEVLSELNQTLRLTLREENGKIQAKLLIPEYFEESVENTPARILTLEMHGCGHRYRYCFRKEQMPFGEYDALFPHVRVQESPEITAELAWYRLQYPVQLTEEAKMEYVSYIASHPKEAVRVFGQIADPVLLRKTIGDGGLGEEAVALMIEEAGRTGQGELIPLLMDLRRDLGLGKKKRKFEL